MAVYLYPSRSQSQINDIKNMPKRARKGQAPCSLEQQARDGFCVGAHPVGDGRETRPQLRPANHRPRGWAPAPTKTAAHLQGERCTRQAAPRCSPNTMLMGLLPWCDW